MRADEFHANARKDAAKHYIGKEIGTAVEHFVYVYKLCALKSNRFDVLIAEFWKSIPPTEPYRVILGHVRDKLYYTRERARQLLSNSVSDVPEEATFTNLEEVKVCN